MPARRVAIVADDLIWATRLAGLVRALGAEPVAVRSMSGLAAVLAGGVDRAIVDLTARAYDGIEAVVASRAAGAGVLAVGQHDDVALLARARAAGAAQVVPYRALTMASGRRTMERWMAADVGAGTALGAGTTVAVVANVADSAAGRTGR